MAEMDDVFDLDKLRQRWAGTEERRDIYQQGRFADVPEPEDPLLVAREQMDVLRGAVEAEFARFPDAAKFLPAVELALSELESAAMGVAALAEPQAEQPAEESGDAAAADADAAGAEPDASVDDAADEQQDEDEDEDEDDEDVPLDFATASLNFADALEQLEDLLEAYLWAGA